MFRVMGVITSDRKHFSNTDPLCIAPKQVCVCVGGVKIGLLLCRVTLGFWWYRYNLNQQMQRSW